MVSLLSKKSWNHDKDITPLVFDIFGSIIKAVGSEFQCIIYLEKARLYS